MQSKIFTVQGFISLHHLILCKNLLNSNIRIKWCVDGLRSRSTRAYRICRSISSSFECLVFCRLLYSSKKLIPERIYLSGISFYFLMSLRSIISRPMMQVQTPSLIATRGTIMGSAIFWNTLIDLAYTTIVASPVSENSLM